MINISELPIAHKLSHRKGAADGLLAPMKDKRGFMRWINMICVAGLLAGCAVHPYKADQVAPGKSVDIAYKCSMGQANILGYSISHGDKSTGFFKAEKAFTPGIASWDWGNAIKHELAVLIAEQPGGSAKINVTASRYNNGKLEKTSEDLKADADTIISACTK